MTDPLVLGDRVPSSDPLMVVTKDMEIPLQREIMFEAWTAEWAWSVLLKVKEPPTQLKETLIRERGKTGRREFTDPLVQGLVEYTVLLWSLVRIMLSGASVISRILWPLTERGPRDTRERALVARAEKLRRGWGLPPDSYLSDRRVRDVFEHVDEKLGQWMDTHAARPATGLMIGALPDDPKMLETCFRLFDPTTLTVYANDRKCELAKIYEALKEVTSRLPPLGWNVNLVLPKTWVE